MAAPLFKPPARDTTTNSTTEIVTRLALVTTVLAVLLGPLLLVDAVRHDHAGRGGVAAGLALLAGGLQFWRWRLRRAAPAAVAEAPGAAPGSAPTVVPPDRRPHLLLLNAALAGPEGNSAVALAALARHLAPHADLTTAALAGPAAATFATLETALRAADGFVIATGTHWDSWSSPLQRFLEDATPAEGTALWLGKPVAAIVTEHSTGGKGVLSRLQGVLVTLGCQIPPMSGVVLSHATRLALDAAETGTGPEAPVGAADFWSLDDLAVVAHNLVAAARGTSSWRAWPVDRSAGPARWLRGDTPYRVPPGD